MGLCGVPGLVAALSLLFGLLSLCICLVLGAMHTHPIMGDQSGTRGDQNDDSGSCEAP